MNIEIDEEIKTLKTLTCIQNMGNKYLGLWEDLVRRYAPKLNAVPLKKSVAYTSHDFNYHCKNIYSIMDNVLLKDVGLTQEEYFVLNVAVLMHDISMIEVQCDRLIHSKKSVEYIDNELEKQEDVWQNVPASHIPVIKSIVLAHSDLKEEEHGGKERVKVYTLRNLSEVDDGEVGKKIHTRWLAGILRLADELDITKARSRSGDKRYLELNDEDKEEKFSKLCWEELQYFRKIDKRKATIELVLNEEYLNAHINDDRENIIIRIKRIWNKKIECLQEVNEYAFDSCEDYINKVKIKNIEIAENDIFSVGELDEDLGRNASEAEEQLIELKKNNINQDETPASQYEVSNPKAGAEENQIIYNQPIYLRPSLGEKITHLIYENKLISHGHYRLNRRLCGTDWIDVRGLLANYQIGTEIIEIMSKDLEIFLAKNLIESNVLLLGIGMNGNILASRVAFQLNLPFSYLVTSKPGTLGTDMEKSIDLDGIRKVVLFTGVISSFDTIKSMVKRYLTDEDGKVKVEVVRIYTILWRPIPDKYSLVDKQEGIEKQLPDKVVYLNEDFPGAILAHEQCLQIKYGKCIARNKQAYEEVYEWPLAVENNNRAYINSVIGCDKGCRYCYLHNIGITQREIYSASEVVSEFERLNQVDPQNTIISFGCYAECMMDENIENMIKLVKYFSEKGYYIQISTKSRIKNEWFEKFEKVLIKKEQLSIFVSIPTFSSADVYEPKAASVEERIENFNYYSPDSHIKIYLYIKPFLEDITYKDQDEYIKLMKKYHMDVIVGKKFQFETHDGDMVRVGKNEMFEIKSEQLENMICELKKVGNVYEHSTDPIRKLMK